MRIKPLILVRGGPGCSRLNLPKVEIGHTPQKPLVAQDDRRTIRQHLRTRHITIHIKRIWPAALTRHPTIDSPPKVAPTAESKRITNPHLQSNQIVRKNPANSQGPNAHPTPSTPGHPSRRGTPARRQQHNIEHHRHHQHAHQRPEEPGADHRIARFDLCRGRNARNRRLFRTGQ